MGSQAGELRHPTRSQGGPHVGQQSSTHGGRHVQVDLSPRSVKLSHSASGAVRRSAAGAVLASSGSGGGQAVAATASAAAAAATGFAPSSTMPWLSMVDDDNYAEEVGEEEEEEGEPPHRPARSEASFASLGGRSLSLGGGCRPGSVSGGGGGGGGSVGSASGGGGEGGSVLGSRPAFLAESVYDGVKSKLRRLQEEVKSRDDTIAALHKVRGGRRRLQPSVTQPLSLQSPTLSLTPSPNLIPPPSPLTPSPAPIHRSWSPPRHAYMRHWRAQRPASTMPWRRSVWIMRRGWPDIWASLTGG